MLSDVIDFDEYALIQTEIRLLSELEIISREYESITILIPADGALGRFPRAVLVDQNADAVHAVAVAALAAKGLGAVGTWLGLL